MEKKSKNSLIKIFFLKNPSKFRYIHKLSKYPKIFQKAQQLKEEMHFEIDSYEPIPIPIQKSQTDGHPLKSASPYEKTDSPALLASLTEYAQ